MPDLGKSLVTHGNLRPLLHDGSLKSRTSADFADIHWPSFKQMLKSVRFHLSGIFIDKFDIKSNLI